MITEQRKTRGIHRRGTRALQPSATDVLPGTLYFVTDEFALERSNGTTWETFGVKSKSILVTYNAANFTASSGIWDVESGDQITYEYIIEGNKITLWFDFRNTNVSAISGLRFAIPGGYTSLRAASTVYVVKNAGAVEGVGLAQIGAGSTIVNLYTSPAGALFAITAANNTDMYGSIAFLIQT